MLVPGAPKDCSGRIAPLESLLRLPDDLGGHSDGRFTVPGARETVNALTGGEPPSRVARAGAATLIVTAIGSEIGDIRRPESARST